MTERRRNPENKRFEAEYDYDDFLKAIASGDSVTTGDIADEIGCDRSTAYRRLGELEERGEVESSKVGNANVWSLVD